MAAGEVAVRGLVVPGDASPWSSSSAASIWPASARISRDPLVATAGVVGGRGLELRAVDGEHRHLDQASLGAEVEHPAAEASEGLLVADPEAGDRRVVGGLVCADHPEGDVLAAAALDPARASLADAVGVASRVSIVFGSWAARPCPSERQAAWKGSRWSCSIP